MQLIAVITTVAEERDARALADAAVQRRLAACVHEERITSTYRWNGEVQREAEIRLSFKTTAAARGALERLILELHPYELPAIHAVAVGHPSADYAAWVIASVDGTG